MMQAHNRRFMAVQQIHFSELFPFGDVLSEKVICIYA